MPTQSAYTTALISILETFSTSQDEVLDLASQKCVEVLERKGLVHLFGSGHSGIPTLEAFLRYGSFVGRYAPIDPRLMWHNVLGPGGVRELLWLERTENYIDKFLDHEPLAEGDVLVVYSHSGKNAAGIDAALCAKEGGLRVIAVTAMSSLGSPGTHSSGKRLAEVAHIVIDTCVPNEDAIVWIDGWDRPLGGSSTVVASIVSHELITRTGAKLVAAGVQLPGFVSSTVPGASVSSNDEVFAEHERYVHAARGRTLHRA